MTASPWRSPWTWYGLALFPIGIGYFMYALQEDGNKRSRLSDPVRTVGEFVKAECVVTGRRKDSYSLHTTYAYTATGYVPPQTNPYLPPARPNFTASGFVEFPSPGACEAALPAAQAAKASHPIWYEKRHPYTAITTLEEPDSRRFLLLMLGALPLALAGLFVGRRRQPE